MLHVYAVALLVALAALIWTLRGLSSDFRASVRDQGPVDLAHFLDVIGAFEGRLKGVEEDVDRLPAKWEDLKREANSFYQRARHHVRRANQELEERGLADPELLDLDHQLHPVDGGGGEEGGMHTLPEGVDVPPTPNNGQATQDPETTWKLATLRRKYG